MMENTDGPDACGPLGHWVIEKDAFDHLGTIAVKIAVRCNSTENSGKGSFGKKSGQYSTVNSK